MVSSSKLIKGEGTIIICFVIACHKMRITKESMAQE
jgi:hypothetical protein